MLLMGICGGQGGEGPGSSVGRGKRQDWGWEWVMDSGSEECHGNSWLVLSLTPQKTVTSNFIRALENWT